MSLNVSTITPASLKAKEVATEEYVDTAVSNMTISDATWQAKVQEAVNNNATTIDGSHIVTGSIAADKIAANTITADRFTSTTGQSSVWAGGGLVSQNFNGNVVGGIGNPTQGFRLSSNAAGTSADPNIYGGYIKGGTIDGATLTGNVLTVSDIKVAAVGYPGNYGPVAVKKVDIASAVSGSRSAVLSFSGRSLGSGYINDRACPSSVNVIILSTVTTHWLASSSISISYSYDNVNWTPIASTSSGSNGCGISRYAVLSTNYPTIYIKFDTYSNPSGGVIYLCNNVIEFENYGST